MCTSDFFDQNPLSQLGLMIMRDGLAEMLTELSGSPEVQIKKLRDVQQLGKRMTSVVLFGVKSIDTCLVD